MSIVNFLTPLVFSLLVFNPIMILLDFMPTYSLLKRQLRNNDLDEFEGGTVEEKIKHLQNTLTMTGGIIKRAIIKIVILTIIFILFVYFFSLH